MTSAPMIIFLTLEETPFLSLKLVADMEADLRVKIPIATLFANPTIALLAAQLDNNVSEPSSPERKRTANAAQQAMRQQSALGRRRIRERRERG